LGGVRNVGTTHCRSNPQAATIDLEFDQTPAFELTTIELKRVRLPLKIFKGLKPLLKRYRLGNIIHNSTDKPLQFV